MTKKYIVDMFPYPSGKGLHLGHCVGYLATDILSRFYRFHGFNVKHPMGFDSFGLPTEQYALKTGRDPAQITKENILRFKEQLNLLNIQYDWDNEIITSDPDYYKFTQWIAQILYTSWFNPETQKAEPITTCPFEHSNHRLLYRGISEVNWCEELNTVLANDEIKDGKSIRGGFPTAVKTLEQFLLRITPYKVRLIKDLDKIEWAKGEKVAQANRIAELHDVVFSRQRLWGEPFPILTNGDLANIPLSPSQIIGDNRFYQETMPSFAGSNWYFFRYLDNSNNDEFCSKEAQNKWLPVDIYIGGSEHTVGHVLYARFITKVLFDLGYSVVDEPFAKIVNVGLLLGPDGNKMSKSSGQAIDLEDPIKKYGSDALRLHLTFLGPLEKTKSWKEDGISGCIKFLKRFNDFYEKSIDLNDDEQNDLAQRCVQAIDLDISKLSFNTCPPRFMTFINKISKFNAYSRSALDLVKSRLLMFCPGIL